MNPIPKQIGQVYLWAGKAWTVEKIVKKTGCSRYAVLVHRQGKKRYIKEVPA
jgi:aminoglycoside/choline kinase family phosphotransferase